MNIVSWNCWGLGSKEKVESVMNLVKKENPSILLIQETKLNMEEVILRCNKFWKNSEGLAISARGASGGLCTVWNDSLWWTTHS
jgi:exonuclease III